MKLPKKIKKQWLAALRSGKYQQTTNTLCDGNGGYCCLGVLEKITIGEPEKDEWSNSGYRGDPSATFWANIGAEVDEIGSTMDDEDYVTDKQISRLVKMNDGGKWYNTTKKKMVTTRKRSFNKIADWIEKHVETID